MAGIVWVRGTPAGFIASPVQLVANVYNNLDLEAIVREAAEMMQTIIATAGTIKSGRSGRIDTAHMFESVKWRVRFGGNKVFAEFGWLDDQEPYFLYQEEGFTHVWSGARIPGMLALADAGIEARKHFIDQLEQALRSV